MKITNDRKRADAFLLRVFPPGGAPEQVVAVSRRYGDVVATLDLPG